MIKNKFLPVSEPSITKKEIAYVTDAVKSGWVSSLGRYINEFEEGFAKYIGTKYALTTCNGTVALHLAMASLKLKAGDEIIVPDLTFIATANAVTYLGAKAVMVDVQENTWCIDPVAVKKAITSKTKAIVPVHLYGHPAQMDAILEIAKKYGLFVIEDAAESHGAFYKSQKVGAIGDCGVFSFYGNKIITTGEGGMITTNSVELYERAKFLRDHAMSSTKRYWHTEVGFNYRITNLQAAMGLAQLERIDSLIEKKRKVFSWYKQFLKGVSGISLNEQQPWGQSVYWMMCVVLDRKVGHFREKIMKRLKEQGIDSRPFFYPITQMEMYASKRSNPISYDISYRGFNLPSSTCLSQNDVKRVCRELKQILCEVCSS